MQHSILFSTSCFSTCWNIHLVSLALYCLGLHHISTKGGRRLSLITLNLTPWPWPRVCPRVQSLDQLCTPFSWVHWETCTDHMVYCIMGMLMIPKTTSINTLECCIDDIRIWIRTNLLKLNNDKMEFLIIGTLQQLAKVNTTSIKLAKITFRSLKQQEIWTSIMIYTWKIPFTQCEQTM